MLESWIFGLVVMVIASVIIAKASDIFELATDYLGRNMNDGVKGLTLNAIGSSFPELLTTVFFLLLATKENLGRDLAASIGGNAGSAIFNSIIIPMLVIQVVLMLGANKFNISRKVVLRDGIFLVLAEVLLLVILSSSYITHWHGWILTSFYFVYIFYAMQTMKKSEQENELHDVHLEANNWYTKYLLKAEAGRTYRSWVLLLLAVVIIGLAVVGLVEGCKIIADSLHINPIFVALILVAAASSVPDTIISMKDARKGNHNDALSNVLGSNIFDITISIGLPLAIYLLFTGQKIPFEVEGRTIIDIRIVLLIVTFITIVLYYFSKNIGKRHVFVLLSLYILFLLYSIGAAQYNAGTDSVLARFAGGFIDYLRQPDGLSDWLQKMSDGLSKGWQ